MHIPPSMKSFLSLFSNERLDSCCLPSSATNIHRRSLKEDAAGSGFRIIHFKQTNQLLLAFSSQQLPAAQVTISFCQQGNEQNRQRLRVKSSAGWLIYTQNLILLNFKIASCTFVDFLNEFWNCIVLSRAMPGCRLGSEVPPPAERSAAT